MGMTDRQFDSYQRALLRDLERIKEELKRIAVGVESKELERLIKDIENELQRP